MAEQQIHFDRGTACEHWVLVNRPTLGEVGYANSNPS